MHIITCYHFCFVVFWLLLCNNSQPNQIPVLSPVSENMKCYINVKRIYKSNKECHMVKVFGIDRKEGKYGLPVIEVQHCYAEQNNIV